MNIGILGGTFDPIHQGHLTLARRALKQFKLNRILFMPAARPPHKKNTRQMLSVKHRLAMVRIAIGESARYKVSQLEIRRKGISYTIDTLRTLRKQFPQAKLYLILGQDAYGSFKHWRHSEVIQSLASLIVAKRPGKSVGKGTRFKTAWIRMPLCSISSSKIRKAVKRGKKVDDYLPQAVIRYIQRHRLYRYAA